MNVTIREELEADREAIHAVNVTAFGTDAEARLVDALRAAGVLLASLVAEVDARVVGHIAFSRVTVSDGEHVAAGAGLAPMAVLPSFQRKGVGAALLSRGIESPCYRVGVWLR